MGGGKAFWDVGAQAMMRGLAPHSSRWRRGCHCLASGVERIGTWRLTGVPLPWASPPPVAGSMNAAPVATRRVRAGCASRATARMKAASSRAMAVQVTVVFCPRAVSARLARRQPALRLPGDIFADLGRHALELGPAALPDPRRMPVGPRALHRRWAHARVAHLGDRHAPHGLPVERSPGTRPRIAMSWRGFAKRRMSPTSTTNVTAVTRSGRRAAPAPPRERGQAPGRRKLLDRPLEAHRPVLGDANGPPMLLLQDDLVGGMDRSPAPAASQVAGAPVLLARERSGCGAGGKARHGAFSGRHLHRGQCGPARG